MDTHIYCGYTVSPYYDPLIGKQLGDYTIQGLLGRGGMSSKIKAARKVTAAGVPMSYTSGGRQFILVAAGGHWSLPAPASDHIIAYALED